jgi:hypothetical protein
VKTTLPLPGPARERYVRTFARAFVASNYLLGRRGGALSASLVLIDAEGRRELADIQTRLVSGPREQRAQELATVVARLVR